MFGEHFNFSVEKRKFIPSILVKKLAIYTNITVFYENTYKHPNLDFLNYFFNCYPSLVN